MLKRSIILLCVFSVIFGSVILDANNQTQKKRTLTYEKKGKNVSASARDLYYVSPTSSSSTSYVGLRVKLYQMTGQCNFVQVSPHKVFQAGEQVRFGVETNLRRRGYLYIFQKGSSGKTTLLFPHPSINKGNNRIKRGTELVIPGKRWFTFDATPGIEELTFLVSKKKLKIISYIIPAAASSSTIAPPPSGSIESDIMSILQGRNKSRDLVLTKPQASSSIVSNNGALYNSIYSVNKKKKGPFSILKIKLKHQ